MADLTHIFDMLVQSIDESSFPCITPKAEYRREEHCVEEHLQWLKGHLDEEETAHLEQLLNAELRVNLLEDKALIKIALATGIRLALPS